MVAQVVGDATDGVCRGVPDILLTILIIVHRQLAVVAGHKLWHPHRSGIRATVAEGVLLLFTCQQQECLQLRGEETLPFGVVEGEGGKRIDHRVLPHIATVASLNPQYPHDDMDGYTILGLGLGKSLFMQLPELHPSIDDARFDMLAAIFGPRTGLSRVIHLCLTLGSRGFWADLLLAEGELVEQFRQRLPLKLVLADHTLDKALYILPFSQKRSLFSGDNLGCRGWCWALFGPAECGAE